jgi:hypothetical protein
MTTPIRYARSGDVNIAYQVTGDGPSTSRQSETLAVRRALMFPTPAS